MEPVRVDSADHVSCIQHGFRNLSLREGFNEAGFPVSHLGGRTERISFELRIYQQWSLTHLLATAKIMGQTSGSNHDTAFIESLYWVATVLVIISGATTFTPD